MFSVPILIILVVATLVVVGPFALLPGVWTTRPFFGVLRRIVLVEAVVFWLAIACLLPIRLLAPHNVSITVVNATSQPIRKFLVSVGGKRVEGPRVEPGGRRTLEFSFPYDFNDQWVEYGLGVYLDDWKLVYGNAEYIQNGVPVLEKVTEKHIEHQEYPSRGNTAAQDLYLLLWMLGTLSALIAAPIWIWVRRRRS